MNDIQNIRFVHNKKSGMTLVEVVIAMFLIGLLCAGLYAVGDKTRKMAEHNRLATEARSLAKDKMEEMIAYGFANLARPLCLLLNSDTNYSSQGAAIIRRPRVVWHAADGSVASATNAAYAEAHVDVTYFSPLLKSQITDSYSMLIEK